VLINRSSIAAALRTLRILKEREIAVTWNGTAVEFSSPDAQPTYVAAALDANERTIAAMMKPGADGQSFLDHVRERHRPFLEAVEDQRPPDVTDDQWQTAVDGLRFFLLSGHGDEALRVGWSHPELFHVPLLWSQIHLCGVALLIGDKTVIGIAPGKIQIGTARGAIQTFRRQPEPDFGLVYAERVKLLARDVSDDEARAWAYDFTVGAYRNHCGCDLEAAKRAVLSAVKRDQRK
jgi:hypothetical protein